MEFHHFKNFQIGVRYWIKLGIILLIVTNCKSDNSESPQLSPEIVENCPLLPRLRVLTANSDDAPIGVKVLNEKATAFPSEKVNITLECLSKSPIDMDFEGIMALELLQVDTFRTTQNDQDCFKIHLKLSTDREATGRYTCWNIGQKEETSSDFYIYAGSSSPPYLLLSEVGEEIPITVDSHSNEAILPCVVTNPDKPVALYKVLREGFSLIPQGDHWKFDPKLGFILQLQKFPDPFGKYKCIAQQEGANHDEVIVILKSAEGEEKVPSTGFNPQIFENQFSRGRDQQSIICTGKLGLQMKSTSNCRSIIECRLMEKCLHGQTICPHPSCKCSNTGQSCSKKLLKQYFTVRERHFGEWCDAVVKNENGGLVHCSSSKYLHGTTMSYFIGLGGKLIDNWRSTATDEILNMTAPYDSSTVYNVGEKIPFRCVASRYVFSRGFLWKLILQDGTVIPANFSIAKPVKLTDSLIMEEAFIHISLPEIKRIRCDAPIWNETSYVDFSIPILVQDTVAPYFHSPENVTVYFHPNEKNRSLVCEAEGFPNPDILWYRNGEEIRSDLIYDLTEENVTKVILTFPEIGESEHMVVYSCNASNPRGMVYKTFTINIRANIWTLVFILTGVAFFVGFAIIMIVTLSVFKRRRKKDIIFHFPWDTEEFKSGNPDAMKNCKEMREKAFYLPYNAKYEIPEHSLEIDYEKVLGEGEFGIVWKADMISEADCSLRYPVAVKTLKDYDMHYFKALLTELKILGYLGHHKNIVKMIGAVTEHLAQRKVYVVVEYCALGSLEQYVRNRRTSFLDEFAQYSYNNNPLPEPVTPSYVRVNYAIKTSDLIKWSYEIASGMEYLTRMKIIHGDVALRNTLLDGNQTAKITDFGLSKQLYKCSSYYLMKSKDLPVPWKWLAPESLRDRMEFASDIWSFGVLLWEMFSLAETPYEGLIFNKDFLLQLDNGYRLDRPPYCNAAIYSIMRDCWRYEPNDRPKFTQLKHRFAAMLPHDIVLESSDDEVNVQNAANLLHDVIESSFIEERQPLQV